MNTFKDHLDAAEKNLKAAELLIEQDRNLVVQARRLLHQGLKDLELCYNQASLSEGLPPGLRQELTKHRTISDPKDITTQEILIKHELTIARNAYRLLKRHTKLSLPLRLIDLLKRRWKPTLATALALIVALAIWATYRHWQSVWHYEFFVNPHLQHTSARQGWTKQVLFDWGKARPAPGIPDANFSMRLVSCLKIKDDNTPVHFAVGSDDGSRLYLEGERLIDQWQQQAFHMTRAQKKLHRGHYMVRIDYYDAGGLAALTGLISVDGSALGNMTRDHFRRPTVKERQADSCQ